MDDVIGLKLKKPGLIDRRLFCGYLSCFKASILLRGYLLFVWLDKYDVCFDVSKYFLCVFSIVS